MSPLMSDDNISRMFKDPKVEATVNEPSTLQLIQAEFEQSFAKVKDKLGESWQDIRTIYEMACDSSFTMKKDVKIVVIGALAYLVSPFDLLPERRLGPLGLVDDVAVLLFALKFARPEVERYRSYKSTAAGGGDADRRT